MKQLERVLPTFVFVVVLGSNLLNIKTMTIPAVLFAILTALLIGLVIWLVIKLLTWWVSH